MYMSEADGERDQCLEVMCVEEETDGWQVYCQGAVSWWWLPPTVDAGTRDAS